MGAEEERQAVLRAAAQMHREHHEGLPQYLHVATQKGGMSMRMFAEKLGITVQRVSQLRARGRKQIEAGQGMDLSWWPVPPEGERKTYNKPVPPSLEGRLREMNEEAKKYRTGVDPEAALAFYTLVRGLHDGGVSFNAIARACGESEIYFLRRVQRWGLTNRNEKTQLAVPVRERKS